MINSKAFATESIQNGDYTLRHQALPLNNYNLKDQVLHHKKVTTQSVDIQCHSVDLLVKRGLEHILSTGEEIKCRAGEALQSYGINYILLDPRNRVHTLRPMAVRYFARELLAYFKGSLNVDDGLTLASKFWSKLADKQGCINSNYGHYVFYSPIPKEKEKNQYEWVVNRLKENMNTRRAMMNINQAYHKTDTKDFPCTVSLTFFIRQNHLICEVSSRSTDIITGLPYDIGFFSFLTELVYADLVETAYPNLQLGYTAMKTTFTQLYYQHIKKVDEILNSAINESSVIMPTIDNAQAVLKDIYQHNYDTEIMEWVYKNADV